MIVVTAPAALPTLNALTFDASVLFFCVASTLAGPSSASMPASQRAWIQRHAEGRQLHLDRRSAWRTRQARAGIGIQAAIGAALLVTDRAAARELRAAAARRQGVRHRRHPHGGRRDAEVSYAKPDQWLPFFDAV